MERCSGSRSGNPGSMMLVVGATGYLGSMIARNLIARGQKVRVLARPQSAYGPLQHAGAEVVFGDLKDPCSLEAACRGIDVVVTTANSAMRPAPDSVETVDLSGNQSLIDAAKGADVKRFIFVSALGVDPNSPIPFMQAKATAEARLRDSGITHTILRPNMFMDVWIPMIVDRAVKAGRPVTIIGEGHRRHSFVAVKDVAAFAVAAVDHPAAANQIVAIGGPEPISWRDIVRIYERAVGRSVELVTLPLGSTVPGLPNTVNALMTARDTFDSPISMVDTARTFGVQLTPVETFIRGLATQLT